MAYGLSNGHVTDDVMVIGFCLSDCVRQMQHISYMASKLDVSAAVCCFASMCAANLKLLTLYSFHG